jgi:hypothetical protein
MAILANLAILVILNEWHRGVILCTECGTGIYFAIPSEARNLSFFFRVSDQKRFLALLGMTKMSGAFSVTRAACRDYFRRDVSTAGFTTLMGVPAQ